MNGKGNGLNHDGMVRQTRNMLMAIGIQPRDCKVLPCESDPTAVVVAFKPKLREKIPVLPPEMTGRPKQLKGWISGIMQGG